jgi:hypothetical protein
VFAIADADYEFGEKKVQFVPETVGLFAFGAAADGYAARANCASTASETIKRESAQTRPRV